MSNGMSYDFMLLLKEAHDHGRDNKMLWSEEKSFHEFLMQYNLINEYNHYQKKEDHPVVAKLLREKGYTIREIARILKYKHPGSITYLLSKEPQP